MLNPDGLLMLFLFKKETGKNDRLSKQKVLTGYFVRDKHMDKERKRRIFHQMKS